jgi:hypothetical protein
LTAKPADSTWSTAAAGRLQLIGKKTVIFLTFFLKFLFSQLFYLFSLNKKNVFNSLTPEPG